jgi:hypothetical protein
MHVLLVCICCSDFVWYIYLVLSMVAWIDGGEGSSVGAWREFISQVQVKVLFEVILRGWSYKVEGAFGGKSGNILLCTKCIPDIWNYFLRELQRVWEWKNVIHDERVHRVQSMISEPDDKDEELHEVLEVSRCEAEFQRRAGGHYKHSGGSGGGGVRGFFRRATS